MSETKQAVGAQREKRRRRAEEMVAKYRAGQTLQQIGDSHGLSRPRVQQILERAGCPRRTRTPTDKPARSRRKPVEIIDKDVLIELYARNKISLTDIRRQLGTTFHAIYRSLAHHKIKRRTADEKRRIQIKCLELDRAALRKLYVEDGLTAAVIAERFGYARQTIQQMLSRHGIRKYKR